MLIAAATRLGAFLNSPSQTLPGRLHGQPNRRELCARVYETRDRDDHDPRSALMHDLDLPRGEERELVIDRDRVYELNGEDSRTLAAVGTFRVPVRQDVDRYDMRSAVSTTDRLCEVPLGECTARARLYIALKSYGGALITELDDDVGFPRAA